jgi:hypothetical protein
MTSKCGRIVLIMLGNSNSPTSLELGRSFRLRLRIVAHILLVGDVGSRSRPSHLRRIPVLSSPVLKSVVLTGSLVTVAGPKPPSFNCKSRSRIHENNRIDSLAKFAFIMLSTLRLSRYQRMFEACVCVSRQTDSLGRKTGRTNVLGRK